MNLWKKIPFKKLIVAGAKALIKKIGPHVEQTLDDAIDKGANKAKAGVSKAIHKVQ